MARGGRRPGTGRKPRPVDEKVREGTYRPDRDGPAHGVRPADGRRPRMPTGLSSRARTAWRVLLDDLDASALLDSADAPLYEAFAVNIARARQARAYVEKHGLVVVKPSGEVVRNPAVQIEREAMREVRMLAESLAIGMSARARLGMAVARGAQGAGTDDPAAGMPPAARRLPASPRLEVLAGGNR